MSSRLLEIGVTNAVLALLAAAIVLLIARWRPNAHLEAVLWLVVLIKFVTPPLVPFSVAIFPPAPTEAQPRVSDSAEAGPPPISSGTPAEITNEKPATFPERAASSGSSESPPPARSAAASEAASSFPATTRPEQHFFAALKDWFLSRWTRDVLIWLWPGGAVLAAVVLIVRAVRFHRLICGQAAREPDSQLQSTFDQLCLMTEIRRRPWLRVVDAEISPLIWGWFGRSIVLLPHALMRQLTVEQRAMVLAHELAHIRRHDHRVRWLEALVQCVYWWLPPVRWIRGRLHTAQEQCCDAWVVANFPGRQGEYCDALLVAARWIAPARPSPILASEFGRSSTLKQRVQVVLHESLPRPLTNRGRSLCLATGLLLLAVSVRWVTAAPKDTPQPKSEPVRSATPVWTQFLVTDPQGRPIAKGEAKVRGNTRVGDFFEDSYPIKQGKALIPLKSRELDQMTIQLDAPGYLSHFKEYRRAKDHPFFAVPDHYAFQLKPGVKIGGKVVDADGQPVANARVYAYSPTAATIEAGFDALDKTVSTNAAGEWQMSGAPMELAQLGLIIDREKSAAAGLRLSVPRDQIPGLKGLTDVRRLPPAANVSASVVDPAGKPVAGAMVLLDGRNFYRDYGAHNIPRTDANGDFSIADIPPGKQAVTIFSLDWALEYVKFSVPLQEPLRIVLKKGKRVEFHTVDEQGHPVAGVRFHPQPPLDGSYEGDAQVLDFLGNRDLIKNRSDQRGIFVWENAPSQPLGYQIYSAGVLTLPTGDYGPAGSPHTLVFRSRIQVHAKVVDAATGDAIKSYQIYEGTHFKVNPPDLWSWELQRPSSRAKPGGFDDSLKGLERTIRFRIQADGYRPSVSEVLDAQKLPNKPVSLEFRLEKDSGFSAVVRTPDGQPAAGAKVYTVTKRRNDFHGFEVVGGVAKQPSATTFTSADVEGEIRIAPSSDPFICFITHDSGYAELMDVDLFKSGKISLVPWAKVEGVLSIAGKPAARVAVQLAGGAPFGLDSAFPGISYSNHATTDSEGRYRFERCVAGEWNESFLYHPARPPVPGRAQFGDQTLLTVTLAPGQVLAQHLGKDGTEVRGRVSLPKKASIDWNMSRAVLMCWDQRTPPDATTKLPRNFQRIARRRDLLTLKQDGSFDFVNVEPAEYELNLSVVAPGDQWFRPTYSKKITITRAMFLGKTTTNPLDLGDIPLSAAASR
jgi:beta-lactamase regulating signal transducer with metallopeptidase domain